MPTLPRSARLVGWGNAALRGSASLDDAVDAVNGPADPPHRVGGLPGEAEPVGLTLALGRLRSLGVTGLRLVLPRPGDSAGLPGPTAFNEVAVQAGEAALTVGGGVGLGLVPSGRATWEAYDVAPATAAVPSLAEADRALTEALREGTEALVRLDVARWHPEVADLLADLRAPRLDSDLPPCYPPRAHRVLATAQTVWAIVGAAEETTGAAVSAGEIQLRDAALRTLSVAARRAVEAACNAALEQGQA